MEVVASSVWASRCLADNSTFNNAAIPTPKGKNMVGSGSTRLGHHRKGVEASSCKWERAEGERDWKGVWRDESEEEERGREERERVQASRRVRVAVMKIGMWIKGGRIRVRRGEQWN